MPIRAICILTLLAIVAGMFTLPSLDKVLVGVNLLFLGVFLVPIIPVSMNFASELTFPIAPATTNGLLLMFGQGAGAVFGLVGTPLCKANPVYMLMLYAVLAFISCVLTIFMVENLKKLEFTKKRASTIAEALDSSMVSTID